MLRKIKETAVYVYTCIYFNMESNGTVIKLLICVYAKILCCVIIPGPWFVYSLFSFIFNYAIGRRL